MKNFHRIIIIGAGPIGLYFASKCEKEGADYIVLEGSNSIGGQLTRLYPEKEIVDIPGIKSIKAKEYIELLKGQIDLEKVVLNSNVNNVEKGENIGVFTDKNAYYCEKLVIATGLGSTIPRPLGVEHEKEVNNIMYFAKSIDHLANKKVAIFGGGDSALDWAKAISAISNDVHLIHRRTEFRGNPDTIKDCKNLKVHLPFVPESIEVKGDLATSVRIKKVDSENEFIDIPVDYIFVNYGNIASQSKFPFEMQGAFILVNENQEAEKDIYVIGDVSQHENKTRRIAPGLEEANKVLKLIF